MYFLNSESVTLFVLPLGFKWLYMESQGPQVQKSLPLISHSWGETSLFLCINVLDQMEGWQSECHNKSSEIVTQLHKAQVPCKPNDVRWRAGWAKWCEIHEEQSQMVWKSREQIKAHRKSTETRVTAVYTKTLPQPRKQDVHSTCRASQFTKKANAHGALMWHSVAEEMKKRLNKEPGTVTVPSEWPTSSACSSSCSSFCGEDSLLARTDSSNRSTASSRLGRLWYQSEMIPCSSSNKHRLQIHTINIPNLWDTMEVCAWIQSKVVSNLV